MKNLTSLSRRGVLPSLDVRGKEWGKWQEGRVTRRDVTGSRQVGENGVGTLAPVTALSEIGFLGLLRSRSRCSWTVPNGRSLDKPKTMRESSIKNYGPRKRERVERRLCTVVGLSDCDRLFTGESEGCEEPFERIGTTRQSHGGKWHV
ncbi:hypothetical protein CRG98_015703 [Punica granatum]|uniref:Uncharacterized protein n=1 Tax=Punica granatum TaxID=22663 RepID=A0A2I0K5U7_PUNGR|nr:hypothetical protein CRG98_015703 [Punica granatum]